METGHTQQDPGLIKLTAHQLLPPMTNQGKEVSEVCKKIIKEGFQRHELNRPLEVVQTEGLLSVSDHHSRHGLHMFLNTVPGSHRSRLGLYPVF